MSANAAQAQEPTLPKSLGEEDFRRIVELAQGLTGIRLDETKGSMLYARLVRRLRVHKMSSFAEYLDYLGRGDALETEAFVNAITTNLTYFFREPHHFDFLVRNVAPELFARGGGPVRIWSAGCSSGEEPYSIAMALAAAGHAPGSYRLLCTDLNTDMVAATTRGVFRKDRIRGLDDVACRTWFSEDGEGNLLAKLELRQTLICKVLNLFGHWPVRPGVDVVFCRNVLIYFTMPQQTEIVQKFAAVQPPGAFLFLGHSEAVQGIQNWYRRVGNTVFQRTADGGP